MKNNLRLGSIGLYLQKIPKYIGEKSYISYVGKKVSPETEKKIGLSLVFSIPVTMLIEGHLMGLELWSSQASREYIMPRLTHVMSMVASQLYVGLLLHRHYSKRKFGTLYEPGSILDEYLNR